jgi:hypothetical protein
MTIQKVSQTPANASGFNVLLIMLSNSDKSYLSVHHMNRRAEILITISRSLKNTYFMNFDILKPRKRKLLGIDFYQ